MEKQAIGQSDNTESVKEMETSKRRWKETAGGPMNGEEAQRNNRRNI